MNPALSKLDLRVRVLLGLSGTAQRLGLLPTIDKICQLPVEKRKSVKPLRLLAGPLPAGVGIRDDEVAGRDGAVPVRVYEPTAAPAIGLLLFIHGGGWVSGGLPGVEHLCAHIAADAGVAVVSVDYRLAPEHPYPAGLRDCYDVLVWLSDNADRFGTTADRIAVAGDSAGGNLAAVLCLLSRREGGPAIAQQILLYPGLDATLASESMALRGFGLRKEDVAAVVRHYLGGADPQDPLVSPLFEPDLAGLPPALIITADVDVVRDDGRRYAQRLTDAGVPTRYTNYVGAPHGFLSVPRMSRAWPQAMSEIVETLRTTLARPDVTAT